AGLLFMMIAIVSGDYHPVVTTALWGGDMFKASPFYILGIVGTSMVFIWVLEKIFQARPQIQQRAERSVVVLLGRSILWIFLLNTIGGYHATQWVLKKDQLTFPQALMAYFGLVLATLVVGYVIAFVVNQKRTVTYA
ncbi:MAG: hypothetical protein K8I00_09435, partial [Candidatus Omnitrophica bacterium]|nr:hypothetical protein [Candidatus Omnitrophota bacterium]